MAWGSPLGDPTLDELLNFLAVFGGSERREVVESNNGQLIG
jgi:hypothetical protein